jgi:malonyl-CoA O-methyltransferase
VSAPTTPANAVDRDAAPLAPREAYRLWAPVYEGETAVSFLDDLLVAALTPPLHGLRLLDAGCGTGRRLRAIRDADLRAGADLTWEMLAAGTASSGDVNRSIDAVRAADRDRAVDSDRVSDQDRAVDSDDASDRDRAADSDRSVDRDRAALPILAAADVRALPFASAAFDVVWCRLVIGHLPSVDAVYAELARVCRPGGTVIVTDFHPEAARAGHTRAFRDADGRLHHVEHHVHLPEDHQRAASAAGLDLVEVRDGAIGPELRPFYERAGRLDRYEADAGLPIVLALAFRRAEEIGGGDGAG